MGPSTWWCRISLNHPDGETLARVDVAGSGGPDVGAVDVVARFALLAVRIGALLVVEDAPPELRRMLELAALGVEVKGQPEAGEETLGLEQVQEEAHLRDPPP